MHKIRRMYLWSQERGPKQLLLLHISHKEITAEISERGKEKYYVLEA